MKTDSLFYSLFQQTPQIFFELIGAEVTPGYRFDAIEVKQIAFRIDGVFLPPETAPEQPVYFVEVQFQRDETLYRRLFAEICVFFTCHPEVEAWRAVIIYPQRATEQRRVQPHQNFIQLPEVTRFYLKELPDAEISLPLRILKLIVEPEVTAPAKSRQLLETLKASPRDEIVQRLEELIVTIIVYKFPQLTREEIAKMLGTKESFKQTRFYQDVFEEGLEQGLEQGERSLLLKLLNRRFGVLPSAKVAQIEALSVEQMENLVEAQVDFSAVADLDNWLSQTN
ncbi:MAG: Rpn family recombination-promoting nuclease/putative transposase [Chloroflexaceae bacterium]|nr:Rpn family recombination-promoting nuclease/putative transposase [Chloroflexaceae bacterium]